MRVRQGYTGWVGNPRLAWADFILNADDISRVALAEMDDVISRALRAGAAPPFDYQGTGMTAVVLCDKRHRAFKVGRRATIDLFNTLLEEYEWLRAASKVSGVSQHVAKAYKFHPAEVTIERECVDYDEAMRSKWYSSSWTDSPLRLSDLHNEINRRMEPHGWSAPEFKDDSYVYSARGPILVDASMAHRLGRVLIRYERDLIAGRRTPSAYERPSDGAFYVRREIGQQGGLTEREARPVLDALARLEAQGNRYPNQME